MNTDDLTMVYPNTLITTTELSPILRSFAEKLWNEFIKNRKVDTNDIITNELNIPHQGIYDKLHNSFILILITVTLQFPLVVRV